MSSERPGPTAGHLFLMAPVEEIPCPYYAPADLPDVTKAMPVTVQAAQQNGETDGKLGLGGPDSPDSGHYLRQLEAWRDSMLERCDTDAERQRSQEERAVAEHRHHEGWAQHKLGTAQQELAAARQAGQTLDGHAPLHTRVTRILGWSVLSLIGLADIWINYTVFANLATEGWSIRLSETGETIELLTVLFTVSVATAMIAVPHFSGLWIRHLVHHRPPAGGLVIRAVAIALALIAWSVCAYWIGNLRTLVSEESITALGLDRVGVTLLFFGLLLLSGVFAFLLGLTSDSRSSADHRSAEARLVAATRTVDHYTRTLAHYRGHNEATDTRRIWDARKREITAIHRAMSEAYLHGIARGRAQASLNGSVRDSESGANPR